MVMKISSIKHFFSSAYKSIVRNKTLSIASIITVTLTLFLFGVLLLVMVNANGLVKDIESKIELQVFLNEDVSVSQKMEIEKKLKLNEHVKEIIFITKEDALDEFKEQLGEENKELVQGYEENNPLPESYVIKVDSPKSIEIIAEDIKNMDGIKQIEDDVELVNQISSFTNGIKWVGIVIIVILIPVSLFLIMNTIKLAVFSRRKEISIMKFVGATDAFIRWPFVIEGLIIGFLGSLMSVLLLNNIYFAIFNKLSGAVKGLDIIEPNAVLLQLSVCFVLGGCAIGILGSVLSLRKFLKV